MFGATHDSVIEIQHGRHRNLTEIREPGKAFLII